VNLPPHALDENGDPLDWKAITAAR